MDFRSKFLGHFSVVMGCAYPLFDDHNNIAWRVQITDILIIQISPVSLYFPEHLVPSTLILCSVFTRFRRHIGRNKRFWTSHNCFWNLFCSEFLHECNFICFCHFQILSQCFMNVLAVLILWCGLHSGNEKWTHAWYFLYLLLYQSPYYHVRAYVLAY